MRQGKPKFERERREGDSRVDEGRVDSGAEGKVGKAGWVDGRIQRDASADDAAKGFTEAECNEIRKVEEGGSNGATDPC